MTLIFCSPADAWVVCYNLAEEISVEGRGKAHCTTRKQGGKQVPDDPSCVAARCNAVLWLRVNKYTIKSIYTCEVPLVTTKATSVLEQG
eukprot:1152182-Pelagomonas_calceolata.AAC.12